MLKSSSCFFTDNNVLLSKGTYAYSVDKEDGNSVPYLTLNYALDNEGNLTNDDSVLIPHKFQFDLNTQNGFEIIEYILNINFLDLINGVKPKSQPPFSPVFGIIIDDKSVHGHININNLFPEKILD